MRKKTVLVLGGLVVAGAATFLASSASAANTINVIEHATTDKVVDVGKKGDSPGDLLTFHNKVYDETDTTGVGTDQGGLRANQPREGLVEVHLHDLPGRGIDHRRNAVLRRGRHWWERSREAAEPAPAPVEASTSTASWMTGDTKCNFVFNIA
jgi:hypothetical protein